LDALAVTQAAAAQVSIQLGQVLHLRHGRSPVALQVPHTPLDVGLLLGSAHQAKQWREGIVAGQGLVAVVQLPLAAGEQLRGHRLGVVPPELARHAAEEAEGLDQAVQDRHGPFGRQGDGERAVGIAPGDQQHRHEPAPLGEIYVDVAEVGFQALARVVVEWDEGLTLAAFAGPEVQPDALVTAIVAVLGLQTAMDLGGGVPLLGWGLGVGVQDGVNDRLEAIQQRGQRPTLVGFGLGVCEDLFDLVARVMKLPRQFANAHLVDAMSPSDTCIFVHLDHP
jgi:hypothetical protein